MRFKQYLMEIHTQKINYWKKPTLSIGHVDISVSLEKEGERKVREQHMCYITCITVFQPTEIRTNTGSVSYSKERRNIQKMYWKARTRARERGLIVTRYLGWLRQLVELWCEHAAGCGGCCCNC